MNSAGGLLSLTSHSSTGPSWPHHLPWPPLAHSFEWISQFLQLSVAAKYIERLRCEGSVFFVVVVFCFLLGLIHWECWRRSRCWGGCNKPFGQRFAIGSAGALCRQHIYKLQHIIVNNTNILGGMVGELMLIIKSYQVVSKKSIGMGARGSLHHSQCLNGINDKSTDNRGSEK